MKRIGGNPYLMVGKILIALKYNPTYDGRDYP